MAEIKMRERILKELEEAAKQSMVLSKRSHLEIIADRIYLATENYKVYKPKNLIREKLKETYFIPTLNPQKSKKEIRLRKERQEDYCYDVTRRKKKKSHR